MRKRKGRKGLARQESLQIMLSSEELKAVEDFRFQHRMPSRAAAIRDLLRRGLGAADDNTGGKFGDYSVLKSPQKRPGRAKR